MSNAATAILGEDGTVTFATNDGTPKTVTLAYHNGNTSIDGLNAGQRELIPLEARGNFYGFRYGKRKPIDISFDLDLDQVLGDGSTATAFEILMKKGVCASSTSFLPTASGDAWMIKATFTWERSNFGASADNVIVWKYCTAEVSVKEGEPSKLSVKLQAWPFSTDWETYT